MTPASLSFGGKMAKLVTYPAIVSQKAGQTRVHFPDLPAADVADPDHDRALLRAKIGLAIIIIDLESHFEPVPQPTEDGQLGAGAAKLGGKVVKITTDLDQY